ncbi:MAG: ubiquinol-cytochrome C chaperone family protein [Alphaproteobacteria bacterium]
MTPMFRWFAGRAARKEAAEKIYDTIVAQSRNPSFYIRCAVPDTLSGRFDMLVIHMFVVLQILKLGGREGQLLAQEIVEAFIREMDTMVRDLGVPERNVPKEVRKIAQLFYGQLLSYSTALQRHDQKGLAGEVWKSFQSGESGRESPVAADAVALYMRQSIRGIQEMPLNMLLQGNIQFPEVAPGRQH